MKGKIFFALILAGLIGGTIFALSNPSFSLKGRFPLSNGWSGDGGTSFTGGGYPGVVIFDVGGSQILPDSTLTGSFWLGNVGWATFSHGDTTPTSIARIVCPTDILLNATQICPLSGYAWSQNAGWIALGASDIGVGSGVYFNPNTANLEGWGWSRALGWVPFWTSITGAAIPTASTVVDPLAGIPINFVSKIAIVGNIAGSRVFSVSNSGVVNQDVGYSYKSINHASILNMIRKNISLMTRNVSDTSISAPFDFVILNNQDLRLDPAILTPYITAGKRSLIVIGGDIILNDVDINAGTDAVAWAKSPIALIALKGASGKGGNIIVSDDVKRIYAYLYAEGTLFSGTKPAATINSYTQVGYFNIPQNQLYIRGFVVSKNTIGGSQQKPTTICPALVTGCNQSNVYDYDWDNFRTYDPLQIATQGSLPAERSGVERLKNAAMIIEYDSRILTDPPPGLREAQ